MTESNYLKIGIIEGGGTGPELVQVVTQATALWCKELNIEISYLYGSCQYSTYYQNKKEMTTNLADKYIKEEDSLYSDLHSMAQHGCSAIFRTALNAQVLYNVRARAWAVKPLYYNIVDGGRLWLIRDQTQGFYSTLDRVHYDENEITIKTTFARERFNALVRYAESEFKPSSKSCDRWLVYKHHILFNILDEWRDQLAENWTFLQPNSAIDKLLLHQHDIDVVAIVGNEVGDLLHEILSYTLCHEKRTEAASYDLLLKQEFNRIRIYQTLHGSADDISGKDLVDPTGALRALSQIISTCTPHHYFEAAFIHAANNLRDTPVESTQDKTKALIDSTLLRYLINPSKHLFK